MIEQIRLLKSIGQFDYISGSTQTSLTPFSLIYGENGRGKTTLASVFRSLAINEPSIVSERHRLGATQPPHVVIEQDAEHCVFLNGAWSKSLPRLAVFDDEFVSSNVCSGIELQPSHRQSMHELILGKQGVELSSKLQGHVSRIETHNSALRDLGDDVPAGARGPFKVDAFCKLTKDENIDSKIKEAERRVAAAKSADSIRTRKGFQPIRLPDFDEEGIREILGQSLSELDQESASQVRSHIAKLGKGGEGWIAEGMNRIGSGVHDSEACPFCSQELEGVELIAHYRAYFSQAYENLKQNITQIGTGVAQAHGGDVQSAFERDVRTITEAREFWKEFAELPEISVDTADIARRWNAARDQVLEQLRSKAKAPLEAISFEDKTREAIRDYRPSIVQIAELAAALSAANKRIEVVKEQVGADDLAALESDLAKLRAQQARFDPDIVPKCDAYLAEAAAKSETETKRKETRASLDEYRTRIFPEYEDAINDYLRRFSASFRIGEFKSVNTRGGSSASYCIVINQQNVNVMAEEGPSFRNTLSAGDRNTLALAFFFASLEKDPDLADKIVVIDDPITSLDDHRSLRTRQEVVGLVDRVEQVVVLSHSKRLLCDLWEQVDQNLATALRINRGATGSEITKWDVRSDSITEHDKRHELVQGYIRAADPSKDREVAHALRPILEAFMRVACPEHFPPGQLLGPFLGIAEQRVGGHTQVLNSSDISELRELLGYANRFHHDTNAAWQTEVINDIELLEYSKRTLKFTSKS